MKTDERPVPKTGGDGDSPRPKKQRHQALTFLRELPGLILMAFALALLIKTLLLQAFWIPTGSMEPTLVPGRPRDRGQGPLLLPRPATR